LYLVGEEIQYLCEHLEIDEFGRYSLTSEGTTLVTMLQRCGACGKYLTMDGKPVSEDAIVRKENIAKAKMRTLTVQINSALYDKLQTLVEKETDDQDSSKIMSEILALGITHYTAAF
jgi:hypothetical protein